MVGFVAPDLRRQILQRHTYADHRSRIPYPASRIAYRTNIAI
jgi:hypothetical protein